MKTPVSIVQINKLLTILGNPSSEKLQHLLANGDLLKAMANARLIAVDRQAFKEVLRPALVAEPYSSGVYSWRPISEYAEKIGEWNKRRRWGLTKAQIATFADTLVDHLDPLHPTGISLWLGRDLAFNWKEVTACLKEELWVLNRKDFKQYISSGELSFSAGSEQFGDPRLEVALLDLSTHRDRVNGVTVSDVRATGDRLPGLEVAWLLALNPSVFTSIDYKERPGFIAAGLSVDVVEYGVDFPCGLDEVGIDLAMTNSRYSRHIIVAFRK